MKTFEKIDLLTKRFLYLILFEVFTKALFLAFNWENFEEISFTPLFNALLWGLNIDLIALILINAIPALITILTFNFRNNILDKLIFTGFNLPFIILSIIDLEYFKFIGRRITLSILDIEQILNRYG